MTGKRIAGCLAAFAVLFYLYTANYLFTFWLRFACRTVAYFLLFLSAAANSKQISLFFSLFLTLIFTACQNIFSAPIVYEFMRNQLPFRSADISILFDCMVQCVLTGFILWLIYKTVPLKRMDHPNTAEWFIVIFTAVCEIYVKNTLYAFRSQESQDIALTTFTLLLQIFLLCFLAFFESFLIDQRIQKEQQIQNLTNQYRLQSLEQNRQCDETIRALNHDIKNHLRAIRRLAAEDADFQLTSYINSLLQDAESDSLLIETGNPLLNGLLADKARQMERNNIEMDALLDFSEVHFLEDWSLCTIFGNLIDNAIEACQHLPEDRPRRICIRGSIGSGFVNITLGNTCAGPVKMLNGFPVTTKEHPGEHGIGLRNVRTTIKKYDGVIAFDATEPGWFRCTVHIPIPEEDAQAQS